MKKNWMTLFISVLALLGLISVQTVYAQAEAPYSISLRRDFGYGNGINLQGNLSLHLKGDSAQVASVEYLMDGTSIATVNAEPFSFAFNTDSYPSGPHQFTAKVVTRDGKSFETAPISAVFLTAEQARADTKALLIPILGIAALAFLVSAVVPNLLVRKSKGQTGYQKVVYGPWGGAICKRCGKPFSRSILGFNVVVGKFERCPHCGKWQITTRTSAQALAEAEALMEQQFQTEAAPQAKPQETVDLLDESRYTDKL